MHRYSIEAPLDCYDNDKITCQFYKNLDKTKICEFDYYNSIPQKQCVDCNCNSYEICQTLMILIIQTIVQVKLVILVKQANGYLCVCQLRTCYNWQKGCNKIPAQIGNEKAYCYEVKTKSQCTNISGTTCAKLKSVSLQCRQNSASHCAKMKQGKNQCTYVNSYTYVKVNTYESHDGSNSSELGPVDREYTLILNSKIF